MGEQRKRVVGGLTILIDRDLCVGFGDCITASAEAFELDDDGIAVFRRPEDASCDQLLEACAACPVDALTVLDEDGRRLVP